MNGLRSEHVRIALEFNNPAQSEFQKNGFHCSIQIFKLPVLPPNNSNIFEEV